MTKYLFAISLVVSSFVAKANGGNNGKESVIPFRNLPFPIKGVSDCSTHTQRLLEETYKFKTYTPSMDISFYSDSSKQVYPVLEGEVIGINQIGETWAVIVKAGLYYFTYYDLASVNVKRGACVSESTVLGVTSAREKDKKEVVSMALCTYEEELNPESIFRF